MRPTILPIVEPHFHSITHVADDWNPGARRPTLQLMVREVQPMQKGNCVSQLT